MKTRRHLRKGHTLLETLIASTLTVSVMVVGTSTYLIGMSSWFRGQTRIVGESAAQKAVRSIAMTLRSAMSVTVSSDGQSLTYETPTMNNGTYATPLAWDGVTRTIGRSGSQVSVVNSDGTSQTLCQNVIGTDPLSAGGTHSYAMFTAGSGTVTRSVTIMVVTQQTVPGTSQKVSGRHRETIFLRNVPAVTD
jgi:hypothetical protein